MPSLFPLGLAPLGLKVIRSYVNNKENKIEKYPPAVYTMGESVMALLTYDRLPVKLLDLCYHYLA